MQFKIPFNLFIHVIAGVEDYLRVIMKDTSKELKMNMLTLENETISPETCCTVDNMYKLEHLNKKHHKITKELYC